MKLFRFGNVDKEKPGVIIAEKYFDVSLFVTDYDEAFFKNDGIKKLSVYLATNPVLREVPKEERIGAVVARPSKIICIRLNYANQAKETNADIPDEPIIFFKSSSSLSGPYDDIVIPKNSAKTDWEVELAFVIGKRAFYVEEAEAMDYIAGFCLHNDYSERAFQLERGGQWSKGKDFGTFALLGPWLITPDEIENVNNLNVWKKVNGKIYQNSNTSNLIFQIPFLVHYVSQLMTLLPGDVITTGIPPGVGLGIKPDPIFIKPGDIIELGIDGLGTSRLIVKAYHKSAVNFRLT